MAKCRNLYFYSLSKKSAVAFIVAIVSLFITPATAITVAKHVFGDDEGYMVGGQIC